MTIKVRVMGNIAAFGGYRFVNEVQEHTDKDFDALGEYSFVNYITYKLRSESEFIGLVYQV